MFKLLRYYAAASLVAVLVTAGLLMWFDRQVSIKGIVQLAGRSNVELAQLAMQPIKPALLEFLDTSTNLRPGSASPSLPPELVRSLGTLVQEDPIIVKIRIYNPHGAIVFSTSPNEIGLDESHNKGFIAAMRGEVGSQLAYRDAFNTFDGVAEDDNVMQTYLPVRAGPAEPIRGVFELYGDVNSMHQTQEWQVTLMAGATLILLALYAVQVLIVRHAHKTIELQQRTIHERTETLALLAEQMIKTEESNKQKIAFELHEGVAQTLAALKMKAESDRHDHKASDAAAGSSSLIAMLQELIQEVRAIATDLRPASLDDLGLLPTIHSLCRELEERHPGVRIEREIPLEEREIPAPLKGILYRITMSVLGDMATRPNTGGIHLALGQDGNLLVLQIDDTAGGASDRAASAPKDITPQLRARFGRMEELTTLSGGAFTATHHSDGGTTLRAAWNQSVS
jgi:hypothetical protein